MQQPVQQQMQQQPVQQQIPQQQNNNNNLFDIFSSPVTNQPNNVNFNMMTSASLPFPQTEWSWIAPFPYC